MFVHSHGSQVCCAKCSECSGDHHSVIGDQNAKTQVKFVSSECYSSHLSMNDIINGCTSDASGIKDEREHVNVSYENVCNLSSSCVILQAVHVNGKGLRD